MFIRYSEKKNCILPKFQYIEIENIEVRNKLIAKEEAKLGKVWYVNFSDEVTILPDMSCLKNNILPSGSISAYWKDGDSTGAIIRSI